MLIPLDYVDDRQDDVDSLADLFSAARPSFQWPRKRHLYAIEYIWTIDRLREWLPTLEGMTILDAGGGAGALQAHLAIAGAQVINISRSANRLRGTTRTGVVIPEVDCRQGQLIDTGLELASLDAAAAVSSIEHNPWEDIVGIVRHILERLKEGAPFVVTVPVQRERRWFPAGSLYPHPVYMWDPHALADLAGEVDDLATLETGALPDAADWVNDWNRTKRTMDSYPGGHRCPYLSGGFVFRRA